MSANDKDELVLNPITGKLDMVRKFNPDRLITHFCNQAGNQLVSYDPFAGVYTPLDDLVVTDENGNVVTT